jgi:8-oxo-(d)GTP phosphatase
MRRGWPQGETMSADMRLIVVRHATAKAKRNWRGRDLDRPLTTNGHSQAKALSLQLARPCPARIISSPSLRCTQTVSLLATRCHLQVEHAGALATDGGQAAVDLVEGIRLNAPPSSTIVLCTHREVLVEVLPTLASRFGVDVGHRLPGAKGSFWTLLFQSQRLISIEYGRPSGKSRKEVSVS